MGLKIGTGARNSGIAGIAGQFDAGAAAGYFEVRTGAPPTSPQDADSGTLLATNPCADPAFGSPSSGTATANSITADTNVDASGTAGHVRGKDSDGNVVAQTEAGRYGNFTADASTDVCTSTAHGLSDGDQVRLTTTTTLPAGLSTGTTYYVRDATANTFRLAATSGGSAINITDAGTGTHTYAHYNRVNFNTLTLVANGTCQINTLTITQPE